MVERSFVEAIGRLSGYRGSLPAKGKGFTGLYDTVQYAQKGLEKIGFPTRLMDISNMTGFSDWLGLNRPPRTRKRVQHGGGSIYTRQPRSIYTLRRNKIFS